MWRPNESGITADGWHGIQAQNNFPPPPSATRLFSEIESQLQADLLQQDGLTPRLQALVKSPNDYTTLKPALFKHIRGTLKLYPPFQRLPKPPSLAEFSFLLQKKGSSLLRESFEDNWTAGSNFSLRSSSGGIRATV